MKQTRNLNYSLKELVYFQKHIRHLDENWIGDVKKIVRKSHKIESGQKLAKTTYPGKTGKGLLVPPHPGPDRVKRTIDIFISLEITGVLTLTPP